MSYEINGVRYDDYSVNNQRIIDKLIEREVYCCMTSEVEYMLSKVFDYDNDNPFDESDYEKMMVLCCSECDSSYGFEQIKVADLKDDEFQEDMGLNEKNNELEDGYLCPVCGCWHKTVDEARSCCEEDAILYKCKNCGKIFSESEYDELATKPEEIYEWWAVSKWFGEKLKEQGCVVLDSWGKSYWGRCVTGQAISLDECVVNIAKSMGILEGMNYEWTV